MPSTSNPHLTKL